MATLKLEIVTPEEKIYSEDVDMVTLPGSEGELGVYPNHVPLLTTLVPGELRVLKNGRETALAIGEGFVEIKADAVSVLTDMREGDYKYVFSEQRKEGTLGVWAEPFTTLRLQKIFNVMQDPYERADITSNTFWDWQLNHGAKAPRSIISVSRGLYR